VVLDSEMDGRADRERCEEGEEWCDVCQAASKEAEADESEVKEEDEEVGIREQDMQVQLIRSRVRNRASKEAREVELFKERLEERLSSGCMFCHRLDATPYGRDSFRGNERARYAAPVWEGHRRSPYPWSFAGGGEITMKLER
jgi:hypothetical protein